MPNRFSSLLAALLLSLISGNANASARPNIVIIFTDDLGYGDLGCYGSPIIHTPHLDRMAAEGLRFTDFYSASSVCTPSRAALLTGRYAIRSGMNKVLFPGSKGGLPEDEITISSLLKHAGYATAHVGKWHLGIHAGSRPLDHGFDQSFGIPYSNDMDLRKGITHADKKLQEAPVDGWNVPLMRDNKIVERPADQTTITKRYTEESIKFIETNKEKPFFLYLAHTFPHTPMFASPDFKGKSRAGIYGDAVEELDWSTGEILTALQRNGLAGNTLVIFTSDNGPWLTMDDAGGSAGLLRDGKGGTWEGGMRVPAIAWMPGRIGPGRITRELAHTMDLLPTVLAMTGVSAPEGLTFDGIDISPLLFDSKTLPERPFFYYFDDQLYAGRLGEWKAHFQTRTGFGPPASRKKHDPPLLFHLGRDPSEKRDVAAQNPDVVARIQAAVATHQADLVPGTPQR